MCATALSGRTSRNRTTVARARKTLAPITSNERPPPSLSWAPTADRESGRDADFACLGLYFVSATRGLAGRVRRPSSPTQLAHLLPVRDHRRGMIPPPGGHTSGMEAAPERRRSCPRAAPELRASVAKALLRARPRMLLGERWRLAPQAQWRLTEGSPGSDPKRGTRGRSELWCGRSSLGLGRTAPAPIVARKPIVKSRTSPHARFETLGVGNLPNFGDFETNIRATPWSKDRNQANKEGRRGRGNTTLLVARAGEADECLVPLTYPSSTILWGLSEVHASGPQPQWRHRIMLSWEKGGRFRRLAVFGCTCLTSRCKRAAGWSNTHTSGPTATLFGGICNTTITRNDKTLILANFGPNLAEHIRNVAEHRSS